MRHLAAGLLGAALLLILAGLVPGPLGSALGPAIVHAASPDPSPAPSADSGDTRSSGEAPGFVGAPWLAVVAVAAIGVAAAGATIAYVRLTGGPGRTAADDAGRPAGRPDGR